MRFLIKLSFAIRQLSYSKISRIYLMTTQIKHASKKFNFPKNNFLYKSELQLSKKEGTANIRNKTAKETKKKLSPLIYRGEILYGIHPVYLALLQKKRHIFQLFLRINSDQKEHEKTIKKDEIERMAKAQRIAVSYVDSKGMNYLAPGVVHQGVCLDTNPLPLLEWHETDTQLESQSSLNHCPLWLVLNEILDPMNVGAIIRSAHYFGINEVFIIRDNSCKLSPTVSKASSGALEVMNIYHIENLHDFIQIKKKNGWNIISTSTYCEENLLTSGQTPIDVATIKIDKPTILILGNEGRGIPPEIQLLCDTFLSIPPGNTLHQGIDSLNVSVAAGVILHALSTKQRSTDCSA